MFKTLEHFDYGLAMGMVYALAMRCTEFDSPQVHHVLEPLIDGYPFYDSPIDNPFVPHIQLVLNS